jgi:hypothetical protein
MAVRHTETGKSGRQLECSTSVCDLPAPGECCTQVRQLGLQFRERHFPSWPKDVVGGSELVETPVEMSVAAARLLRRHNQPFVGVLTDGIGQLIPCGPRAQVYPEQRAVG